MRVPTIIFLWQRCLKCDNPSSFAACILTWRQWQTSIHRCADRRWIIHILQHFSLRRTKRFVFVYRVAPMPVTFSMTLSGFVCLESIIDIVSCIIKWTILHTLGRFCDIDTYYYLEPAYLSVIILGMGFASGRRCYTVTPSLIAWAHI